MVNVGQNKKAHNSQMLKHSKTSNLDDTQPWGKGQNWGGRGHCGAIVRADYPFAQGFAKLSK